MSFEPTLNPSTKEISAPDRFVDLVQFKITQAGDGRAEGWLHIGPMHQQSAGLVHGGAIATLADTVAGYATASILPAGQRAVTAELKVSYFQPAVGEKLHAIGWVLKQGRKINFCEAEIWLINGADRKLVAKASITMATLTPKGFESLGV